jgi:hypothetical protein
MTGKVNLNPIEILRLLLLLAVLEAMRKIEIRQ